MKLIVGLGNPGKKYENTRHNMGFMAVGLLSDQADINVDKEVFHGLMGRGKIFEQDVILFKPTTFMNLSGTAVQEVVHYFKIVNHSSGFPESATANLKALVSVVVAFKTEVTVCLSL